MSERKGSGRIRQGMFRSPVTGQKQDDEDDISTDYSADDDDDDGLGPEQEYDVEGILAETVDDDGVKLYLVQWEVPKYDILESTWEPQENIIDSTILDNWRDKKMRILRSNEKPFDVEDFEQQRLKRLQEQADRHHRKKQKRKRLGLPVSPSASESEVESHAGDSESSIEAEEINETPQDDPGLNNSSARANKAARKPSRSNATHSSSSKAAESTSARQNKEKDALKYQSDEETSEDFETSRKSGRKEISKTRQRSKDQSKDRGQVKNDTLPKHTRNISQSSSDTPLAQTQRKLSSDSTASRKASSASNDSRLPSALPGQHRAKLEKSYSLLGLKTGPEPRKASKPVSTARVAQAVKASVARGGRGAVRGGYGNVFSSRSSTAARAKKKTLTDIVIDTVRAPDPTKPLSHFSTMKMGWNVQKASRQIADSAPDISALPGGLINPSKSFQALRPEDVRKPPPPAAKAVEVHPPQTANSIEFDKPEDPTNRSSFYIQESRDPAKDNPYNMICYYWHENGHCYRQYDKGNPCKYWHTYSSDIPVAPRPGDSTSRAKQRCKYGPSCAWGSSCEYYHPERQKQQGSVDDHDSSTEDKRHEMILGSIQALANPLPPQEPALMRRESDYNGTHLNQHSNAPTSSSSRELCRYGLRCRNGIRCKFYHPEGYGNVRRSEICRFFLVGGVSNCHLGDACNFLHPQDNRDSWAEPRHAETSWNSNELQQESTNYPAARTSKKVSFADDQAMEVCEEPESFFNPEFVSDAGSAEQTKSDKPLPQDRCRPTSLLPYNQDPLSQDPPPRESSRSHLPSDVPLQAKDLSTQLQLLNHQSIPSTPASPHTERLIERPESTASLSSLNVSNQSNAMPPRKLSLDDYKLQQAFSTTKGVIKKATFGTKEKRLVILKFAELDLSLDLPWTRSFGAPEQLDFAQICIAQDFQYQQTALNYKVFGQGAILPSLESTKDIDALAEYLKSNSSGLICVKNGFIALLYHARCEGWKFLETGAKPTDTAIRYLVFQPKQEMNTPTAVSKRLRSSAIRRHSGNAKQSFYLGVLTTAFMKLSFSSIQPNPHAHKHPLFYIMFPRKANVAADFIARWILAKRSDSKIYSSDTPGSWDYFVNAQASSKSVFFYESAVAAVSTTPSFSRLINNKTETTSFWLIEDFSLGFPRFPLMSAGDPESIIGTTATQILPLHGAIGGAILLTPNFIIAEPEKVLDFLLWFQEMSSKSPAGLWKLVCCSNMRSYLLDLAIEKAGELKSFRVTHREDDAMDANALKKGLSHEKCSQRFEAHEKFINLVSNEDSRGSMESLDEEDLDLSEALKGWPGIHDGMQVDEELSPVVYADSFIDGDDEKGLVTWFSDWSIKRLDVFRRFIVIGTGPEHSDRAYRLKYHLRNKETNAEDKPRQGSVIHEVDSRKSSISFSLRKPDSSVNRKSSLPKDGYDGTSEHDENGNNYIYQLKQKALSVAGNKHSEQYAFAITNDGQFFQASPHLHLLPLRVGEIIPAGTVLVAHSGCPTNNEQKSQMRIKPGDSIQVIRHVKEHMYYGLNVTTQEEGQFLSGVFWIAPGTTCSAMSGVPRKPGWIEVLAGDLVKVEKGDGLSWYVGTNRRSNEFGKFPDTILGPDKFKQEGFEQKVLLPKPSTAEVTQHNLRESRGISDSRQNHENFQSRSSGRSQAVIPNNTILHVKTRCYITHGIALEAFPGQRVEILKHVSGHMYFGRNLSTGKTGQISESAFENDNRVENGKHARKKRRVFEPVEPAWGPISKSNSHITKKQVCGYYNTNYCTWGDACMRRHICCECGSNNHGSRDCPGPVYQYYSSDTDDEREVRRSRSDNIDPKVGRKNYDGNDDSMHTLSAAGIETTADGERVIPLSTRPSGSTRPERAIRPGYTPDEDREVYKNRRVVDGVPQFESESAARKGSDTINSIASEELQGRSKRRRLEADELDAGESERIEPAATFLEATTSWYGKQKAAGEPWEHLFIDRWENAFRYIDDQLAILAPKI